MDEIAIRPLLRGTIHQIAFFVALAACAFLLYHSQGTRAVMANGVYSFSLIGLYGISALYHLRTWSHHVYVRMRKLDHAAIYALIAGSATPICLLGLRGANGDKLFYSLWGVAFTGMIITIFWSHAPKGIRAVLYVVAGWIAIPYFIDIVTALGLINTEWLVLGGFIYTLGAFVYALKRPNWFPHVFGYHEIFHTLVVIGSGIHFYVIYSLVRP